MSIDPNDPRPPYRQVADDLRRKIQSGEQGYKPGSRLPSIRMFAKEYGISPQTTQSALRELRGEGLVVSQQGRAFFVRDPDRPTPETFNVSSKKLAETEAIVRSLQKRVAAIEENSDELRALIVNLYSRIGQSYPGAAPEESQRRGRTG